MSENRPPEKRRPHYDLELVKARFEAGEFEIPSRVRRHMALNGWTEDFGLDCVRSLRAEDFHKSQAHHARPGVWLDIYRPRFAGERYYVKYTIFEDGRRMLLLSFCRDSEPH